MSGGPDGITRQHRKRRGEKGEADRIMATCAPCKVTIRAPRAGGHIDAFLAEHAGHGSGKTSRTGHLAGVWAESEHAVMMREMIEAGNARIEAQRYEIRNLRDLARRRQLVIDGLDAMNATQEAALDQEREARDVALGLADYLVESFREQESGNAAVHTAYVAASLLRQWREAIDIDKLRRPIRGEA